MYSFSNIKCGLIIIAAVTMGLFALGMVFAFKRGNVTINPPDSLVLYSDQSLPTTFFFPSDYDVPQQPNNNNSEWIKSTLDFIESTYRAFGIRSGFLNEELFLRFDSDFYSKALNYYCKEIGNGCPLNEGLFVASSFPQLLEKISDFSHLFVSNKYCDSSNCDINKVIQSNPLILETMNYNWAISVSDIKQLLSESEQPILMTIPYPYIKYIIPCSDHRANCHSKNFTCPDRISTNENCTFLLFPAELSNGEFYKPEYPAMIDFGPPLTFLLYGWNDDFVTKVSNSMSQIKTVHISRGGFFVKRSIEKKGNSVTFYGGSLLFSDNDLLCGSPHDPQRWTADDILVCINESLCDTRFNYSIVVQKNGEHIVNSDMYGISVTKMRRWNKETDEVIEYDAVPYQNLDLAFHASKSDNFDPRNCAYWFLPYDLVDQAESIGNWSEKKVHAVNFAVKWTKGSYSRKNELNYEKVPPRNYTVITPTSQ